MRWLAAGLLVMALGGCATDAGSGTQRVEIDGTVTAFAASGDGRGYALDVPELGLLPLELGDLMPPMMATGVVVEVPAEVEVPADAAGEFAALAALVDETGEPLRVVEFVE